MTAKIVLTGTGGIGSLHLQHLAAIDGATVVAVCDIDGNAARAAGERFDASDYTDHERMIENEDADAAFVTVPPFAHTTQEVVAAEHGLDLFVEKPLALARETATEVNTAIAATGVRSQVGHMLRYSPVVERAMELVDGRDLAVLDGHWFGGVPPVGWWGKKERSGGQVVEQTSHIFDLVRYFGGEIQTVEAAGGKNVVGDAIDFEDTVSAAMKHDSGAVSTVTTTSASPEDLIDLRVVGEDLALHLSFGFDDSDPSKVLGSLTGTVDGEPIEFRTEEDAYRREVEAFVRAVETGDASDLRSSYDDARKTFELTLDVAEALDHDRTISVTH